MTIQFRPIPNFHQLPSEEASRILYQELLPACEAEGVKLAPEGHVPDGSRYEQTKKTQTTFDIACVQRAFSAADFIYQPAKKYRSIHKILFEMHPQGGYVSGGEMIAAMILKGYTAKFDDDQGSLQFRPQFQVREACSGCHRSRLFVGEANFSGVTALLEKHKNRHPNLGRSIIATELKPEPIQSEREAILEHHHVTVEFGFDGTKIHENPLTRGKIFERIHWNCPHDGSSYKAQTLPAIIKEFFSSAKQVQLDGHRIHITLAQPIEGWDKSSFYQGVVYNICDAAQSNAYTLYAKRPFGNDRYPGYSHEQTNRPTSALGASRLREFVFMKGPLPQDGKQAETRSQFFSAISETRQYFARETDNESSSYSDSDSD